ncbi:MAG: hypothetical protein P9F19_02040 [Candidatus Contendobacter sp.]|nr:hypothetical protein [Candidatus Contendobacter sp.]MDG4556171.1 hypothetical protein [Candidatus Contendobacter sp.]
MGEQFGFGNDAFGSGFDQFGVARFARPFGSGQMAALKPAPGGARSNAANVGDFLDPAD